VANFGGPGTDPRVRRVFEAFERRWDLVKMARVRPLRGVSGIDEILLRMNELIERFREEQPEWCHSLTGVECVEPKRVDVGASEE